MPQKHGDKYGAFHSDAATPIISRGTAARAWLQRVRLGGLGGRGTKTGTKTGPDEFMGTTKALTGES